MGFQVLIIGVVSYVDTPKYGPNGMVYDQKDRQTSLAFRLNHDT